MTAGSGKNNNAYSARNGMFGELAFNRRKKINYWVLGVARKGRFNDFREPAAVEFAPCLSTIHVNPTSNGVPRQPRRENHR